MTVMLGIHLGVVVFWACVGGVALLRIVKTLELREARERGEQEKGQAWQDEIARIQRELLARAVRMEQEAREHQAVCERRWAARNAEGRPS